MGEAIFDIIVLIDSTPAQVLISQREENLCLVRKLFKHVLLDGKQQVATRLSLFEAFFHWIKKSIKTVVNPARELVPFRPPIGVNIELREFISIWIANSKINKLSDGSRVRAGIDW
jgi:hypothetical protein